MNSFISKLVQQPPSWLVRLCANLWPPFLGAGVRIEEISPDYLRIKVGLVYRWYNKNYVRTQFGGSIYTMTDPFYMMMLIFNLGPDYVVWDKAAQIEFKKPGRTQLTADFYLTHELIQEVKRRTKGGEKYVFELPIEVKDENDVVVAKIIKTLYVRLKVV